MRNRLIDLNDHLFDQLERLMSADTDKDLQAEVKRSKSVASVGKTIVDNARLAVDAQTLINKGIIQADSVAMIESKNKPINGD
jgi:hypothetical protein